MAVNNETEKIVTLTVAECGEFHDFGMYYGVNSSNTFPAIKNRIIKSCINGLMLGTSGSGYMLENKGTNKIL